MSIAEIIDRMAEIKREKNALEREYDGLQAQIQIDAESRIADKKIKSVNYFSDSGNSALVTVSDNVTVLAGELLAEIFGKVYQSMVKQEVKYTLKAPAKRILSAIWHKEYCEGSIEDIINSLDCDGKTKNALLKKLKGVDFDKDKENLMNFAGLSEDEASDTAYLINEAAAWENICAFIKVNNGGELNNFILSDVITKVNSAVNVSRGIKTEIAVAGGDSDNEL